MTRDSIVRSYTEAACNKLNAREPVAKQAHQSVESIYALELRMQQIEAGLTELGALL